MCLLPLVSPVKPQTFCDFAPTPPDAQVQNAFSAVRCYFQVGRKEGEQAAQRVVKFVTFAIYSTHQVGSCDCDSFCPSPVSFRSSSSSLHSRGNSSVLGRVTDCFPLGRFFDRMIGSLSNCEIAWPQEEERGRRPQHVPTPPTYSELAKLPLLSLRFLLSTSRSTMK